MLLDQQVLNLASECSGKQGIGVGVPGRNGVIVVVKARENNESFSAA